MFRIIVESPFMRQVKLLRCSVGSNPTLSQGYLLWFVVCLCIKSVICYKHFGFVVVTLQNCIAFLFNICNSNA